MPKYYSQNGEDIILWSLFEPGYKGRFLDVGALDGRRFSNTLSFEEQGWTGICVEAHPDYIEVLKKNRPNSSVIHAAVTDKDLSAIKFYANSRGSLSTLDKSLEPHFAGYGKFFTGFDEIEVPAKTIDSILCNGQVDLVSIDIEGSEPEALKGFSIRKYLPRVIVLEELNPIRARLIEQYMYRCGYRFARRLVNNVFYCTNDEDAEKIFTTKIDLPLIHTPHPLDRE